jgi:hypothetical protein
LSAKRCTTRLSNSFFPYSIIVLVNREVRGATTLPHIDPLHAIAGALVGLLVGVTGVGGGSLMTPILKLVFGFAPATAVGTDLLYAAVTKTVGTSVHGLRKTVDWRIVRRLASGSLPAAVAPPPPPPEI